MLTQEVLDGFKRDRIAKAVVGLAHDRDVTQLTVGLIVTRARMARNTFYELFKNRADALAFSWKASERTLLSAIDAAAAAPGTWEERVESILRTLLQVAETEPQVVEFYLCHGHGIQPDAGPPGRPVVDALACALLPGRRGTTASVPPPRTEELLSYGLLSVIAKRLREGESEGLIALTREMTRLSVLPFLAASRSPIVD
jgi:AcrR family transcriptional regulator